MDPIFSKLAEIQADQRENTVTLQNQSRILDKHSEILESQNETLIRNTLVVEEHHKRSLALEKRQEELEAQIEPIQDHVKNVAFALKIGMWIGGVSTFALTLAKIVSIMRGLGE